MRSSLLAAGMCFMVLNLSYRSGLTADPQQLLVASNHLGNNEIFLISVDGSDAKHLTNNPA